MQEQAEICNQLHECNWIWVRRSDTCMMKKKGIRSALFRSVPAYWCGQSSVSTILGRGITQSCSNDHLLYIFLWCAGHFNALLISGWAYPLLSTYLLCACTAANSSTLNSPIWMGQNVLCDLHVGLPFLLEDHFCLGDISVSPTSPCYCRQIQLCRVCGAVHLPHLLPMPSINNKNWYKRQKV